MIIPAERMLLPPTRVCTEAGCEGYGRLLRLYAPPKKVSMFSHAEGVYEGLAVKLTCKSMYSSFILMCM